MTILTVFLFRVLSALYTKSIEITSVNTESYTSQFVSPARTGFRYQLKAFYNVVRYNKGENCPASNLPLASCKLTISYADQTVTTIRLSKSNGYILVSKLFTPESSARYIQFYLTCKPATESPQCADIVVLLDDVTFTDPGHTCWTPLGCWTDSTSNRVLPRA